MFILGWEIRRRATISRPPSSYNDYFITKRIKQEIIPKRIINHYEKRVITENGLHFGNPFSVGL